MAALGCDYILRAVNVGWSPPYCEPMTYLIATTYHICTVTETIASISPPGRKYSVFIARNICCNVLWERREIGGSMANDGYTAWGIEKECRRLGAGGGVRYTRGKGDISRR